MPEKQQKRPVVDVSIKELNSDGLKLTAKIGDEIVGGYGVRRDFINLPSGPQEVFMGAMNSMKLGQGIPRALIQKTVETLPQVAAKNGRPIIHFELLRGIYEPTAPHKLAGIFQSHKYKYVDMDGDPMFFRIYKPPSKIGLIIKRMKRVLKSD
ncbi:MAG: hypothetical protein ABIG96_05690 [Candidatus Micrarchaeota archaeon]